MKRLFTLIFLLPALAFADAVIFSGNDVKTLKQNIDLFGVAKILSGSLNPSVAGVAAPQGSIYLSTVNGTYEKTGPLATDWTKFGLLPIDLASEVTGILPPANGGTGLDGSSAANGSLLIGNGTGYTLSTLTGTTNQVSVANGAGSITLSLPQDIATSSDPSFNSVTVTDPDFGTMNLGQTIARAASTGVLNTGGLSIDTDPSKFDLGLTNVVIVDNTDPVNPTRQSASCGPYNAQTLTNLGTQPVTYISLDALCNIIQSPTYPTPDERRQYAFVGRVNHSNFTTISFVNTIPDLIISPIAQTYDLFDALGPFNISGNEISANGSNLSFNKSAGELFQRSNHYLADNQNPHFNITPGLIAAPFRYTTQTTTAGSDVTVIDPTNYDVGGTITAVPNPTNTATVQRIYLFGSNNLRVLYGQATYPNLAAAIQNFQTETFVVNPAVQGFAVLVGFIAIQKNCTSLQDTTCSRILLAPRFAQGAGGGGGGGGTTTLQQAYLNSVQPQITLNSTQSGVELRDASTPIGVDLLSVKDNAGSRKYFSVGAGFIGVPQSSSAEIAAFPDQKGNLAYNTTNEKLTVHQNTGRDGMILTRGYAENLTLVNNDTLFLNLYDTDQTILVSGNSGPITLDAAAPFGFAGTKFNQLKFTLIGNSDTNTVTIPAGTAANTVLGYSVTLGRGQTATYQWNATLNQFVIISVSN